MQTYFEKELAELKESLLTMASHAEAAVRLAIEALMNRDAALAAKVRADDEVLDRFEIEIDELALKLLAKAPLASDLRLITVATKVSQNLERVGDEAAKISKRARDLSQEAPLNLDLEIPRMAELVLRLLKDALDSFVNHDASAARALLPQDKEINALHKQIQRLLVSEMAADPGKINRCLHLMVVIKSLERIADHAKNIGEEVVFLCEALDIRHAKLRVEK